MSDACTVKSVNIYELPDIVTTEEAARFLRIEDQTVRKLLRARKIPGFRVGGSWRLRRADLIKIAGVDVSQLTSPADAQAAA